MSKINREKLIEAMVGIRTDEVHAQEWIAEFADMLLADVEPDAAENLRLHALNLAVALHKDSIRFVIKKEQPAPDTARIVLATADRFNAWLNGAASTEFIGAAECPTPQQILDLRLRENDSGADTVRGYLAALVEKVWDEGQSFSGRRPFGKSGWKGDFNRAFIEAGWVAGKLDVDPDGEWVDVDEVDDDHVDRLVRSAIKALAGGDRD